MRTSLKFIYTFVLAICVASLTALGAIGVYLVKVVYPSLPPLDALVSYEPKEPLRVYASDGTQIGEFGVERRIPYSAAEFPSVLKQALLAAEDARFYEHSGVDPMGLARAAIADVVSGGKAQGASTLTMQLARNFYLPNHKTYARKILEILLAIKIEKTLSKDEILQLYMNQIFLGRRSYGFGAAARTYYGVDVKDLTVAQAAMLAGLPKAPSTFNPVSNPQRARQRQAYVLGRMLKLAFITDAQYEEAIHEPDYQLPDPEQDGPANSVGELVRRLLYEQMGDTIYERGLRVWTTIDLKAQQAAQQAVQAGVSAYGYRHDYPGPEAHLAAEVIALPEGATRNHAITSALAARPRSSDLVPVVVTAVSEAGLTVVMPDGTKKTVPNAQLTFGQAVQRRRPSPGQLRIVPGSIIRLRQSASGMKLDSLPQVQAALVAVRPQDGAIQAIIGGNGNAPDHLNRATQSWRQPGSAFKPFIYAAAVAKGMGPQTIVDDAPLAIPNKSSHGGVWRPREDGAPLGPITLQEGVAKSKNFVAIRVLRDVGVPYARQYLIDAFGFDPDRIEANLPMALGAGEVTPLQLANAYAVLANGGFRVRPYLIARIVDSNGTEVFKEQPAIAGVNANAVIRPATSYLMTEILRNAARHGTGAGSNALGRSDLAGKTGTTNAYRDGWFAGYQQSLSTVVWMGFDTPRSLGAREYGSRTALPIWVDFMRSALDGVPITPSPVPDDITLLEDKPYDVSYLPGQGYIARVDAPDIPGQTTGLESTGANDASKSKDSEPPDWVKAMFSD